MEIGLIAILGVQIIISIFVLAVLINAFIFFLKYPKDIRRLDAKIDSLHSSIQELINKE